MTPRTVINSKARQLLAPSRDALLTAASQTSAAARFDSAHRAAAITAETVLNIRMPHEARAGSCWDDLRHAAPELTPWATAFAVAGLKPLGDITAKNATDLLRDAEAFHHLVEQSLGLPYRQVLPGVLPDAHRNGETP